MQNKAGPRGEKWHKSDTARSTSVLAIASTSGNENAAEAATSDGDISTGKHSSVSDEKSYHNGLAAAIRAGHWYAENRDICPRPIIGTLRAMFGLSALEAIEAIRHAKAVRP